MHGPAVDVSKFSCLCRHTLYTQAELGLLNTNCDDGLMASTNGVESNAASLCLPNCWLLAIHLWPAFLPSIFTLTCPSFRDWRSLLAANVPASCPLCGLQCTPRLGSRRFTSICKINQAFKLTCQSQRSMLCCWPCSWRMIISQACHPIVQAFASDSQSGLRWAVLVAGVRLLLSVLG